ncbi:MAG: response regulator transcription factor [Chitinophagaceae bacterium]
MINFLLADDHHIIRSALKALIRDMYSDSNFDEAKDGESTFELIKRNNYELVILDVNMPNTDSFGLISNILSYKPETKILMFSMNAEDLYAKRYLKMGARGYLKKDEAESEIQNAIRTVLSNKRYISQTMRNKLTEEALGQKSTNPFDALSPREFEVLRHLIKGESVSEIGQQLSLHTSTIGTHKARIFEKLGIRNVVDIAILAKVNEVELSQ